MKRKQHPKPPNTVTMEKVEPTKLDRTIAKGKDRKHEYLLHPTKGYRRRHP